MSNWKCWRRAWSWRSFIVFLVYSVCAFFLPLNVCKCDFWIESRERADKKSAPSVEHVREQNTEQKPGKIVRIFYKHIVILIKHIPLISCWHFSLFASIRPFFTAIFLCASFSELLPRLVMFYFLTVGCVEKSFTFSVIHSVGTLLVEMTNAVVCLFNKKM